MKTTTIEDVSEILNTFDLEEIESLIKTQVEFKEGAKSNYFKPIFVKYRSIMDSDAEEELKEEARNRFVSICKIFINTICNKYHLSIDTEWVEDNEEQLPALVTAFYCFFVKDLPVNIQEVCISYIHKNQKSLYSVFEERKNKKDAHTLVNKGKYTLELAVILANIYDASTWILHQLSEEEFIQYLNPDYAPLRIIDSMLQEGIITGEFVETITEIYAECVGLKSEVCLNIMSSFTEDI